MSSVFTVADCGYPPISKAPLGWQEDPNLYASVDGQGQIWLIRNPASWGWSYDDKGRTYRHRPEPIRLEDAPAGMGPRKSRASVTPIDAKARAAGDSLLEQAERLGF